ncbi:glutamyl-tRNA(gln) amidotransferase subunit A [Purpureocillium lavendulum]|uniref:amidase n=1 Tax=Purpureocillium lavendulum TaxID=1247861 RepID=A0AB34FWH6_9HYPO|nr:glutamyl-tRNA(gln) amidotransferase subunit A [Purpureocillium lavendulum]
MATKSWEERVADKRSRLDKTIPAEWRIKTMPSGNSFMSYPKESGILSGDELAITESNATDLVRKLANGELTSVAVTTAFCKRAALAQQLLNCNLEFFPEMALAQAKGLDDYYAQHKKPGLECTMGYVAWIGKYDTEDSVLVTMLRKAGAVFYVKTSVPQSLMVCETLNNVIGRTVNPRNKNWSCGGSSGGEGAIVGFRGGVIGVGTDIGGSIRVPSAFNNLFGLRPSHGRLPYANMANSMEGQETIHSVCGPMCHTIDDLRLFVTSVLAQSPWRYDAKVLPMPWRPAEEDAARQKLSSGGLTLGFYSCDGNVLPHPPILRAVDTVVAKAKEAGHTVVSWEPYKHPYAVDLANRIYAADGGADVFNTLKESGEPAIPNFKDLINPTLPKLDINRVWDANLEKWHFQNEYLAKLRALEEKLGREVDAIIAPITPTAAVRHDQFKYYGYATAINVLDFTSVVVPVTFADKSIDVKDASFQPLSDMDKVVQAEYDAEAYDGAPVAVQIIGRRLTEEKTIAIAEHLAKLLGN